MLLDSNNISGDVSLNDNNIHKIDRAQITLDKLDTYISSHNICKDTIKSMIKNLESKLTSGE